MQTLLKLWQEHWFDIVLALVTLFLGPVVHVMLFRHADSAGRSSSLTLNHVWIQASPIRAQETRRDTGIAISQPEGDKGTDVLIFAVLISLAAAGLYLKHREQITYALARLTIFSFVIFLSTLVYLASRRLRADWFLFGTSLLFVVLALGIYSLHRPFFGAARYSQMLATFGEGGLEAVVRDFGIGVFLPVYQFLGVLILALVCIAVLLRTIFVWSSVNLAVGARGQRLWLALARKTASAGPRTGLYKYMMGAAVFGLILSSGAFWSAIEWWSEHQTLRLPGT